MYSNRQYWQIKFKKQNDKVQTIWACDLSIDGDKYSIVRCKKDGSEWFGKKENQINIILGRGDDIIYVKDAKMNLKYGWLEVVN